MANFSPSLFKSKHQGFTLDVMSKFKKADSSTVSGPFVQKDRGSVFIMSTVITGLLGKCIYFFPCPRGALLLHHLWVGFCSKILTLVVVC